jgi:hypothetical protein
MHLSHLDTYLIFIVQEDPKFYLVNGISPVFQALACTATLAVKNLSTVRIACGTSEAVKFLENTIVDRHLISNLPAINVRMMQIPFTVGCDIK